MLRNMSLCGGLEGLDLASFVFLLTCLVSLFIVMIVFHGARSLWFGHKVHLTCELLLMDGLHLRDPRAYLRDLRA